MVECWRSRLEDDGWYLLFSLSPVGKRCRLSWLKDSDLPLLIEVARVNARVLPLVAGNLLLLTLVPVLVLVLPLAHPLLLLLDVLLLDNEDCESILWWENEFERDTVAEVVRPWPWGRGESGCCKTVGSGVLFLSWFLLSE